MAERQKSRLSRVQNVVILNSNLIHLLRIKINPIVAISQGKLRGSIDNLLDGTPYYSFKGIPYAQTPIGEHRFKAPFPPKRWQGILDATQHGPVCPQYDLMTSKFVEGKEECLFLNIYTKSLASAKLPVMVYIYGGAFMSGSGDSSTCGPQFLIQHDVLLVTFNYRLETLGFLCLDTPEVPGNAGLKDQVAALRWVRENIDKFGGDPNNVTIFGQSAGGASVTFHMLSDMSKGLFHKAIAQSGSCYHDWAIDTDPVNRAFRAGKVLGIETENKDELLQHLQKVQPKDLARLTFKTRTFDEKNRGLSIFYTPVVEKSNNAKHFITMDPADLLLNGKVINVPLMIGTTSREGAISVLDVLKKVEFLDEHPSYLLPKDFYRNLTTEKLVMLGEKLKKFYFKEKGLCIEKIDKIIDFQSDRLNVYNCNRFAHYYSTVAPTFLYKFDCDTELNYLKNAFGIDVKGACHIDDFYYLFCNNFNCELYEKHEHLKNIVDRITKLWTDFAKTGIPTPNGNMDFKWEAYTPAEQKYLLINENDIKMCNRSDSETECFEFWNELYKEAGLPSISKQAPNLPAKY